MPAPENPSAETAYDVQPRDGRSVADVAGEWSFASRKAKEALPGYRQLRFGNDDAVAVDLFAPSSRPRGLVLFLHGGFWLQGSKDIGAFPATMFNRADVAYASASYGLAPRFGLGELIANVRQVYTRCLTEGSMMGLGPQSIVIIGHSAGAYLAAWLAREESAAPPPAGIVLISGIFDLVPLVGIKRLAPLRLDDAMARRLSISGDQISPKVATVIAAGSNEAHGFIEQSLTLSAQTSQSSRHAELELVAEADHFDIARSLDDPAAPVTSATLAFFDNCPTGSRI